MKGTENSNKLLIPARFPVINVASTIMPFPGTKIYFFPKGKTTKLIEDFNNGETGPYVFAVLSMPEAGRTLARFYRVGVVAELSSPGPERGSVTLESTFRVKLNRLTREDEDSYFLAEIEPFPDKEEACFIKDNVAPNCRNIVKAFLTEARRLVSGILRESEDVNDPVTLEMIDIFNSYDNYDFDRKDSIDYFVWRILSVLPEVSVSEKQSILENRFLMGRLKSVLSLLVNNLEIIIGREQVQEMLFLEFTRRQDPGNNKGPRHRQKKLGPPSSQDSNDFIDSSDPELGPLWERYKKIRDSLDPEVQKIFIDSFGSIKNINPGQAEWSLFKRHLDFILDLYSTTATATEDDILKVEKILGESHYGMEDAKERIYNYIAAKIMNPKGKAPILCFDGPPGVGKTSIGKSVAESLGRNFIRLSLGGLRDETEINGHKRTYIGALPGKIISEIRRSGVRNPVFMLDEVDKLSNNDFRGDPSSALLEVLDPEQNHSFRDHYVDAPFDLSDVLFLCTSNFAGRIQPALKDRMQVVRISGYTEFEKIQIAKQFLIPKQAYEAGLTQNNVTVEWPDGNPDRLLSFIISGYTREAGVRGLEQEIGQIFRRLGREYLKLRVKPTSITITEESIEKFRGIPKYTSKRANITKVGEVIGLAWTETGGNIIYVQSKISNYQKFSVLQTGLQGQVMIEAGQVALSLLRGELEKLGEVDILNNKFIHLHIPDGAVPKDGPSAGITAFCSLYSAARNKLAKPYIAITGEVTLTGRINGVGGIKEKILAAHRDGIKEVVLPESNKKDIKQDVPEEIKTELTFHFVNQVSEVIPFVFTDPA